MDGSVPAADLFFPGAEVEVDRLLLTDSAVLLAAHPRGSEAVCPECGQRASRVHRYGRRTASPTATLTDAALFLGGRPGARLVGRMAVGTGKDPML